MTSILNKYIHEFYMNPNTVEDYKIDYIKNYYYNIVKSMITWYNNNNTIDYLSIGIDTNSNYLYFKSKENKMLHDIRYNRKYNKYEKYNSVNKKYDDCTDYNELYKIHCDDLDDLWSKYPDSKPKRQNAMELQARGDLYPDLKPKRQNTTEFPARENTYLPTREPEVFDFEYNYEDVRPRRQSAANNFDFENLRPERQSAVNNYDYNEPPPQHSDHVTNVYTHEFNNSTPPPGRILRSSPKKLLTKKNKLIN